MHINTYIHVHRHTHKYIHTKYLHTHTHTHTHTHMHTNALTQVIFRLKSFGSQSKTSFRSEADMGWEEEEEEQEKRTIRSLPREMLLLPLCVCAKQ